jgi:hypothetical protein
MPPKKPNPFANFSIRTPLAPLGMTPDRRNNLNNILACNIEGGDLGEVEKFFANDYGNEEFTLFVKHGFEKAIDNNKLDILGYFIKVGVDVNLGDSDGKSPLSRAIDLGFIPVANLLVENGAKVEGVDKNILLQLKDAHDSFKKREEKEGGIKGQIRNIYIVAVKDAMVGSGIEGVSFVKDDVAKYSDPDDLLEYAKLIKGTEFEGSLRTFLASNVNEDVTLNFRYKLTEMLEMVKEKGLSASSSSSSSVNSGKRRASFGDEMGASSDSEEGYVGRYKRRRGKDERKEGDGQSSEEGEKEWFPFR